MTGRVKDSKQKWIVKGYEMLAKEGPDNIQAERLARILKRNKSGFYHFFKNPENFIHELLNHHRVVAKEMRMAIGKCETLDPDYFMVLVKHKHFILVQGQLDRKAGNPLFYSVIKEIRGITDQPLLPLWRKTFHLPDNTALVLRHFNLFRSAFLAQVNAENLTFKFLHTMYTETNDMMREIFRHSNWNRRNLKRHELARTGNTVNKHPYAVH